MTISPRPADSECGFVPFPNSGAYGHWACQLRRWHMGPHRFINYTVPRIPRVWRVGLLYRQFRLHRRLRSYGASAALDYRRALYPTTYSPRDRVSP